MTMPQPPTARQLAVAREIAKSLGLINQTFEARVQIIAAILARRAQEPPSEVELRRAERMFTWLCAVAQPMSPHMDGTFQWRIPTHLLPRAKSLRESVELALLDAALTPKGTTP